ncbi:Uncharacterised protein [Chryseobacterium taklimakanense]|uniref:TNase-like domain-containing protein n=1 Tax=Chryseobacterium taklimakanense TaxID=536441 RepID=A0A239XVV0_9FLAO|nr:Uncharacterised protein [Chryseobacterium taklimakanense]
MFQNLLTLLTYFLLHCDLAYVILPGGECLNELILRNGYAKPSSDYFCFHLPYFQQIDTFAKMQKKGIYAFTSDL